MIKDPERPAAVSTSSETRLRVGIRDVAFGARVVVVEPTNLYECKIGDDSFIGPFVEIQRGVVVGNRCRIQSHALICELVTIGDECFVSHGVMFVNDKFQRGGPARGDRSLWRATTIGDRVSFGTGSVILPVRICSLMWSSELALSLLAISIVRASMLATLHVFSSSVVADRWRRVGMMRVPFVDH